ncbi:MAG: protein-disulfide reductase DsbD domain-containing protein, partial [Burkholderiaceae bacterium]
MASGFASGPVFSGSLRWLARRLMTMLAACLVIALVPTVAGAAQAIQRVGAVEVELIASVDAVAPGQAFKLGLRLKHEPQWHTYWVNPGDSGLPTQFKLSLPSGFSAGDVAWPRPSRFL